MFSKLRLETCTCVCVRAPRFHRHPVWFRLLGFSCRIGCRCRRYNLPIKMAVMNDDRSVCTNGLSSTTVASAKRAGSRWFGSGSGSFSRAATSAQLGGDFLGTAFCLHEVRLLVKVV